MPQLPGSIVNKGVVWIRLFDFDIVEGKNMADFRSKQPYGEYTEYLTTVLKFDPVE